MEGLAIRTVGLTKRYGQVAAVDGLNLAVESGEILGLVGPDGAGKTTLVRLLAAVTAPTAGQAWVLGHNVADEAQRLRSLVGYMAQRFSLYGDLSVMENLLFFARVFQVPPIERSGRVARLLAFARLSPFKHRLGRELSGGMQKKLALACSLVHEPRVLFLDEPTTGVDPVSRREFWDILSELHVRGATIVLSTPYMDEAERCTRVAFMHRGQVLACDTPARLRRRVSGAVLEVETGDVRRACEVACQLPGVHDSWLYGDRLHLLVDPSAGLTEAVTAALAGAGLQVGGIRISEPRIEQVFGRLLSQDEQQRSGR